MTLFESILIGDWKLPLEQSPSTQLWPFIDQSTEAAGEGGLLTTVLGIEGLDDVVPVSFGGVTGGAVGGVTGGVTVGGVTGDGVVVAGGAGRVVIP